MTATRCPEIYVRNPTEHIQCTYIAGHTAERHSWQTLMDQDEADAEASDPTPTVVQAFLDAILEGEVDPYLEAILAAGHNRKRTLRGTRGFPSMKVT